jgi:hypothetical protein
MMDMKLVGYVGLAAAVFGLAAAGCSSSTDGGASSANAPPFPQLASYDRSCLVDSECALVPGEGCASCDIAALGAKAASTYATAVAAASQSSACRSAIESASPCSVVHVTAGCQASLCVVRYPVADAGADAGAAADAAADAGADGSPLDASTD